MMRVIAVAGVAVAATVLQQPTGPAVAEGGRTGPTSAGPSGTMSGCADLFMLGLAGSGEQSGGGAYGTTVAATMTAIQDRLGSRTIDQAYVRYEPAAASNRNLLGVLAIGRDSAFIQGERRGVRLAREKLEVQAERCPEQALVVVGYSQGAMVAVDALLETTRGSGNVPDRVTAVALVANPYAHPEDSSRLFGDAGAQHRGIFRFVGQPGRLGTARWSGRVFEVCRDRDVVCDAGPPHQFASQVGPGMRVHGGYAAGSERRPRSGELIDRMAAAAANNVRAVPLTGGVSRQIRRGVQVTGTLRPPSSAPSERLHWQRVSSDEELPPGIRVSRTGELSGVATTVGEWRVSYDVWNPRIAPGAVARVDVTLAVNAGATSPFTRLSGHETSCAERLDRHVVCDLSDWTPPGISPGGVWDDFDSDNHSFCGIRPDATLWCMGDNQYGQIGNGTYDELGSEPLTQVPGSWAEVRMNWQGVCAVQTDASGWCWGRMPGSAIPHPTPEQMAGSWSTIDPGTFNTCGISTGGGAHCWGSSRINGQDTSNHLEQVAMVGPSGGIFGVDWTTIDASQSCGLGFSGDVWCWGTTGRVRREASISLETVAVSRGSFGYTICGLDWDAQAFCWGRDESGQVGDGPGTSDQRPYQVPGDWLNISTGDHASCGVRTDHTGWCWGTNEDGQLGDGSTDPRDAPVQVPGDWLQIERSDDQWGPTFGIATDGSLWCWGEPDSHPRNVCTATSPVFLFD